jgi:catechol 2,3-dioxygenase-like lactoylglutathione lyase family enzyme
MLKRVDRVQIAVRDGAAAERVVAEVFGGELLRRDDLSILRAKRSTMQAGSSLIELLEPDGTGPVTDFLAKYDGGLYGAGFSVDDLDAAARHLDANGVRFERASGQLYLDPKATFGINAVLSKHHERNPVGTIKWIYEVTNVVADWHAASDRYAKIFNLDASKFSPITSPEFGYTGTLTLFNPPEHLDRIEISQLTAYEKAMGRFHRKRGDSLYMFFVETDDVDAFAQRLEARGSKFAPRPRDKAGMPELFIHPTAFNGVLVGVSRTEHAWTWSGDPQRARRAAAARASA